MFRFDVQHLTRNQTVSQARYMECLGPIKAEAACTFTICKYKRCHSHPHQITAVYPLITLCYDRFLALQRSSFCCPFTGYTGSVIPARKNNQRCLSVFLIPHGRFIDRHDITGWKVLAVAALPVHDFVFNPHISKGTSHHHLMISSSGSIGVELMAFNPV